MKITVGVRPSRCHIIIIGGEPLGPHNLTLHLAPNRLPNLNPPLNLSLLLRPQERYLSSFARVGSQSSIMSLTSTLPVILSPSILPWNLAVISLPLRSKGTWKETSPS